MVTDTNTTSNPKNASFLLPEQNTQMNHSTMECTNTGIDTNATVDVLIVCTCAPCNNFQTPTSLFFFLWEQRRHCDTFDNSTMQWNNNGTKCNATAQSAMLWHNAKCLGTIKNALAHHLQTMQMLPPKVHNATSK